MFKAEGITVRDLYYIEDLEDKSRIGITMAAETREGISAEEAAASYLKRDYRVEKIENNTLPLGTLKEPEQESISRQLCDGDYIIMVTDDMTVLVFGIWENV